MALLVLLAFLPMMLGGPIRLERGEVVIRGVSAALVTDPQLLTQRWSARWIYPAKASPSEFGVYHFRKTLDLATQPNQFVVHVSGDNRYQLFVNGTRMAWGPARGDLFHWRYETLDLAPKLHPGRNVLAAVVWNYGSDAPEAQVTNRTAFLLQGDTPAERVADTGPSWKCAQDRAYQAIPLTHSEMRGYYVVGPGERLDGSRHPWGWETADFDDSAWSAPETDDRSYGSPRPVRDAGNRWMLVPRSIPMMEETPQRLARLRAADGVTVPQGFPGTPAPFRVPPRAQIRLLLDQGVLTTGYPELMVSHGRGATISLRYAEALYEKGPGRGGKGNRDQVEGKEIVGNRDEFAPDGGNQRLFRPLWWRTWRYMEVTIQTADEELTIEDLRSAYTGYPFERRARFEAGSEFLTRVLDTGWRTARLCAHETYMDCPYYEQLQYAGDTRIQALISLYDSGDDRLMRNAIEQLNDSRTAEGATMSRAPTRQQQYIPGFSLWWIGMVHDYWMYRDDPEFLRRMLPGVRAVLEFYAAQQTDGGLLGSVPWWNYVDWTPEWPSGVPPSGPDGTSALHNLQLLLALQWATDLEDSLGSKARAAENRQAAASLAKAITRSYWNAKRRIFTDTADGSSASQQTNVLAILAGIVPDQEAPKLIERILTEPGLVKCSLYFRHYLHAALNRAGLGDRLLDMLGDWQAMLDRGLSTWAEVPEIADRVSRSDCHAWSASPNFELFRTVLGVDSAAPGFSRVTIRPFLGKLTKVSGSIPHPKGEISVKLEIRSGRLEAEVELPMGLSGEFRWQGKSQRLSGGLTKLSF
jgi:alpha-L-rhamnosidase